MLKKLGSPDTVLAVEVVGKLEKDDYRTVLVPGLDDLLERLRRDPLRLRVRRRVRGPDGGWHGRGLEALLLRARAPRLLQVEALAPVATGHGWLRHALAVFQFMMPGEIECFEPSQVQAAIDWAAA